MSVPVNVLRRQLLVCTGLHSVDPTCRYIDASVLAADGYPPLTGFRWAISFSGSARTWNGKFSLSLQEGGIGVDELVGLLGVSDQQLVSLMKCGSSEKLVGYTHLNIANANSTHD